ncbi:hypothetical protein [Alloalcanivorax xenomutans]|uniref:hypothetical protein n=1 Tax=Alloalcanivorax xenomutans TaxID=1094342 RepID=UPI0024E21964|nr:hypothetical protein [Alloalcanivorax xenomutans]
MAVDVVTGVSGARKRDLFLFFEAQGSFFLYLVLLRVALEISYIFFIIDVFSYRGFDYNFTVVKYVESWAIMITVATLASSKMKRPSDLIICLILIVYLVPLLIYYAYSGQSRYHLYLVILCYLITDFFRRGRLFKIKTVVQGPVLARYMLILGVIGVTAWMVFSGGFRYFNLDISKVYDYRSAVGETINVGLMAYLNIWATKVFGPALLTVSIWKRRYVLAFLIVLLHVVWFGVSSHKSVLFYPLLVIFVCCWFRRTSALSPLPLFMAIVVMAAMAVFLFSEDILAASLFIRRVFFVPSQLTFAYYDFFSNNPHVYWSNSVLSSFGKYPYSENPALVIGNYMGTDSNANNSYLSTGYMHAGVLGVMVYGAIAGAVFKILDSLATGALPVWVATSVVLVPAWGLLTSADLTTALLTHGFGVALFMLFLIRIKHSTPPLKKAIL